MRDNWQVWTAVLTDEQCDNIIEFAEQIEPQKAGIKLDGVENDEVRRSTIRWLPSQGWIADMMMEYSITANRNAFGVHLHGLWEIQYTEYHAENEGHYGWHHDVFWDSHRNYDRKLSIVVQLSDKDDYAGGEFQFSEVENPVFRERGSVMVFPSYLQHRVLPVTEGTRRSLVGWVDGPRWR